MLALSAVACGGPAGGPAEVRILEPADGSVFGGSDVPVRLGSEGVTIAPASSRDPGTAHHHLLLDVEIPAAGVEIPAGRTGYIHLGDGDSTFMFRDVTAGEHRLIAVLGDSAHVPLAPLVSDTVRFTVGGER